MNTQVFSLERKITCLYNTKCPYLNLESTSKVIAERDYLRKKVDRLEGFLNLATSETIGLKENIKKMEEENKLLKKERLAQLYEKFKANKQKEQKKPKKRGAPVGHIGITRKKPVKIDEYIEVTTEVCPFCDSNDLIENQRNIDEHIVEDIEIKKKVICYRHHKYYCRHCKKIVIAKADKELKKSYIGANAVSLCHELRYTANLPYGKIIKILDIFGLRITKGAIIGMDNRLTGIIIPFYERLKEIIKIQKYIHADETGWRVDGVNHWLWVYTNALIVLYHIDPSRGSCVVEEILGKDYSGILISDCYSAYNILEKAIKQKCTAHFLRDNNELSQIESKEVENFYEELKYILQTAIQIHKDYKEDKATAEDLQMYKRELSEELAKLLSNQIENNKAEKLRKKLNKRSNEIFTFLDNPEIEPTNNRAERQLRANVIMRKNTFGNRSEKGALNHAVIMSLTQTLKLHGYNSFEVLSEVITGKKDKLETILENLKPNPP